MYLYKFRTMDKNALSCLANNQFWFDKLCNQNDPFEGECIVDSQLSEKQKKYVTDRIDWVKSESNICSFSYFDEEETDDPLYNSRMWGHYSDGLRGFCLVFNSSLLEENLFENGHRCTLGFNVDYKNTPKIINNDDLNQIDWKGESDSLKLSGVELVARISTTKSKDWEAEKEVRFISFSSKSLIGYNINCLNKVIVGEKMEKSDQELLFSIIKSKYPKAEVLVMKMKSNSYKLETEALNM